MTVLKCYSISITISLKWSYKTATPYSFSVLLLSMLFFMFTASVVLVCDRTFVVLVLINQNTSSHYQTSSVYGCKNMIKINATTSGAE